MKKERNKGCFSADEVGSLESVAVEVLGRERAVLTSSCAQNEGVEGGCEEEGNCDNLLLENVVKVAVDLNGV